MMHCCEKPEIDVDARCKSCGYSHHRLYLEKLLDLIAEEKSFYRWLRNRLCVPHGRPVSLTLTLEERGIPLTPFNPTQTILATVTEADAAGVSVAVVPANLNFTISDSAVALFTDNNDGTATIIAVAPGTTNFTATDKVNNLTGSVSVTVTAVVVADKPTTLTITLGEPATKA